MTRIGVERGMTIGKGTTTGGGRGAGAGTEGAAEGTTAETEADATGRGKGSLVVMTETIGTFPSHYQARTSLTLTFQLNLRRRDDPPHSRSDRRASPTYAPYDRSRDDRRDDRGGPRMPPPYAGHNSQQQPQGFGNGHQQGFGNGHQGGGRGGGPSWGQGGAPAGGAMLEECVHLPLNSWTRQRMKLISTSILDRRRKERDANPFSVWPPSPKRAVRESYVLPLPYTR
jgi:hypothetical protein